MIFRIRNFYAVAFCSYHLCLINKTYYSAVHLNQFVRLIDVKSLSIITKTELKIEGQPNVRRRVYYCVI